MTHDDTSDRLAHARRVAVDEVSERLAAVPELPPELTDKAVYGKYSAFADSPSRILVPVLVEHASRRLAAARRDSGPA